MKLFENVVASGRSCVKPSGKAEETLRWNAQRPELSDGAELAAPVGAAACPLPVKY